MQSIGISVEHVQDFELNVFTESKCLRENYNHFLILSRGKNDIGWF